MSNKSFLISKRQMQDTLTADRKKHRDKLQASKKCSAKQKQLPL